MNNAVEMASADWQDEFDRSFDEFGGGYSDGKAAGWADGYVGYVADDPPQTDEYSRGWLEGYRDGWLEAWRIEHPHD